MTPMTYRQAAAVIEAALSHATNLASPSSVAVMDSGRNLIALARQDGAVLASLDMCVAKAYTAASLQLTTASLRDAVQPGAPLYGLAGRGGPPYIPFGGGRPLRIDDEVVGAVGVAGGSPEQDDEIAAAATAALTIEVST